MLIDFPESRYVPSVDAAAHEVNLAQEGYDIAQEKGFGSEWPYAETMERFRAARERLHRAMEYQHLARMREYQKKDAVWK
jgi:hypothetical protein